MLYLTNEDVTVTRQKERSFCNINILNPNYHNLIVYVYYFVVYVY